MKKINYGIQILIPLLFIGGGIVYGQNMIPTPSQLENKLEELHSKHTEISRLENIAQTPGGNNIHVLTIGKGDFDAKPGMAVVGGVDGSFPVSRVMALRFAEDLLSHTGTDSISNLLDSLTFYIVPSLSPDAAEQYFSTPRYERKANARPTDDDRDGRMNEDPFEDLNNDGLITMVRIKDPTGEWIIHEEDERVMIKADKNKGEKGRYILLSEGIDNDKDGKFNEDGEGGVIFNRNMPFRFEHFQPGSGEFPVSEPGSKGLLDYLYEKWNVFAVFTFGPGDNLSSPMKYDEKKAGAEIITGIQEEDARINAMVSEKYNELTGKKSHAKLTTFGGGFMQWAYFHYGRMSFGTPAFYVPEIKAPEDTTESGKKEKPEYNPEVNFLRWADSVYTEPYFAGWTPVEHPDFPGREAETGGFYPYVKNNPPAGMIDSLSSTHNRFIVWLASARPRIDILNLRTVELGNQVYRIEMDVYNGGLMLLMTGIGEKTRWVKKPKVNLILDEDQQLLSGKEIILLDKLRGDDHQQLKWLVKGKGTLQIEAGSPQTGIQVKTVDLK